MTKTNPRVNIGLRVRVIDGKHKGCEGVITDYCGGWYYVQIGEGIGVEAPILRLRKKDLREMAEAIKLFELQ
ncbi:MAG: hypothetical protein V3U02_04365 [Calditrichia bacterium]